MHEDFRTEYVAGKEDPVHLDSVEWLRQPFRTIHEAISILESELGPKAGIFHYSGYVGTEELEEQIFGKAGTK